MIYENYGLLKVLLSRLLILSKELFSSEIREIFKFFYLEISNFEFSLKVTCGLIMPKRWKNDDIFPIVVPINVNMIPLLTTHANLNGVVT